MATFLGPLHLPEKPAAPMASGKEKGSCLKPSGGGWGCDASGAASSSLGSVRKPAALSKVRAASHDVRRFGFQYRYVELKCAAMKEVHIVPIYPTKSQTLCPEPHAGRTRRAQYMLSTTGERAETVNLCIKHLLRRAAVDPDVQQALGQIGEVSYTANGTFKVHLKTC